MGACCVSPQVTDEAIDKCQTIPELISVMVSKKEQLPLEKKEISQNIDNPTFKCTYSDISGLSPAERRKRIPYLEQIERLYGNVINLLENNPKLNVEETKKYLNDIWGHYCIAFDDKKQYNITFDKFRTFVEKSKEKK